MTDETPSAKEDWVEMWQATDAKGIGAETAYSPSAHLFRVKVSHGQESLTETFNANYEPIFGMDVSDHGQSLETADRLATQLEQKLGL
jgi:hypothetical protein